METRFKQDMQRLEGLGTKAQIRNTGLFYLASQEDENPKEFQVHGGDHGWIFPSLTRARPRRVIPVAEPKEWRVNRKTGKGVQILLGLHALRRTHNSVGIEAGVLQEHREALLNHNNKGVNVEHYGQPQNWEHLAECQAKISKAILGRLDVTSIYPPSSHLPVPG